VKDDRVFLLHIREAIARISEYTRNGRDLFFSDTKTQDAVVRNLEIVGEAVKNLSDESKSSRPDIPWRLIGGMRDKLIHHYFGVNLDLVWQTVEVELPKLAIAVGDMLRPS
jgi:uncharacterized protein with HEPN domain